MELIRTKEQDMTTWISTLCVVLGLGAGATAFANTDGQFGVVDMQAVILNVSEGKAARAKLEGEIKGKEKELMNQKQELDKLNESWKKTAALLSEEARINKQKEFQEKFLALRNAEMSFQGEIKRKEAEATQKIAVKVARLVEKIARDKKLTGVFETNTAGLLYLEKPVDLTKEVIAEYEKMPKQDKK